MNAIELTCLGWILFWAWMLIPIAAVRWWFDRFDPMHTLAGQAAWLSMRMIVYGVLGIIELDILRSVL